MGRGWLHKSNKNTGQDNLHKMVTNKSLKSKEMICGNVTKEIFDVRNVTVMLDARC